MAALRDRLVSIYGDGITKGSMIGHEGRVAPVLAYLNPKTILEIGTYQGVSAVLWAQHCDSLVTLDIKKRKIASEIWTRFGVEDHIEYVIVDGNAKKKQFTSERDIDLAFVDGEHSGEGVKFDFECVKHAKAVLFHDYKPEGGIYKDCTNNRFPDVAAVINSLDPLPLLFGPTCSQFALWLNPAFFTRDDRDELGRVADAAA